jgi:tetratricopeptide (TPR) repeat protein
LAGNYLKSLQLQKQLEQRAKEAAKSKQTAEKERDALESFLEACKQSDVDLSDIDKLLSEFSASINAKDYQSAIGHARKAMEAAKSAYLQKISDVADSVEALLKLIKGDEGDAGSAREVLEKSRDLALKEDLEGAMKKAKEAYNSAERAFHEHFSARLSQAQEIINQAKEMGDDVSLFEDLLNRSKAALEKQDYEGGISQLTEALEGAGENLRSQIEDGIGTAEDLARAGEGIGADMERVKGHMERAKGALEALRYRDALSYSKRAGGEAEKAISNQLSDMIRDVKDGMRSMKTLDEDSRETRALLDEAQEAIKEKRFLEAIEAFNKAKGEIHEIHFQTVLTVIAKAKDKFVLAKKVGVDMSDAIELLNTSRDNLKKGMFEEAIKVAEQSEDAVESALEVFYRARDELVELSKAIKIAKDMGHDISEPKALLSEAKKAFEKKDFEASSKASSEGIAKTRKATYDVAVAKTEEADAIIKLGISMGAEMTDAEETLRKATESMSGENLAKTVSLAEESAGAARAAVSSALSERLGSIEDFVSSLAKKDKVVDNVTKLIEQAMAHVKSSEFEDAHQLVEKITSSLEGMGKEECERLARTALGKIEVAKDIGGKPEDIDGLETSMKEVQAHIEKKSYEEAISRSKSVVSAADDLMLKLLQAEFSSIKDSLEEAKTFGIDVSDAKDRLKDARVKAESREFKEAHDISVGTKSIIDEKVKRHDEVKKKIEHAEELIQEASRNIVDVSDLTEQLDDGRKAFSDGLIDQAEAKLDNTIEDTEKRLAMYLAAKFILSAKEALDQATSHGIEAEEAQALLTKAKEDMKSKDYDDALDSSRKSSELAAEALSKGVGELVQDVRRMITDAKNVSIDTAGPEKLIEKAHELLGDGDFAGALGCIDSAKEDIDQVRNLSSSAGAEIKNARNNLKEAEMLNMDVGEAREKLDQAIEALTRHQYAIALELAKKSSQTSIEATKSTIWNTLEESKAKVAKASEDGLHVGTADRCVADGIEAFNSGRYEEALRFAMRCDVEMERAELQKDISTRAVENARRKVVDATAEGIKADAATFVVEKAEQLLAKGKYPEALTSAIESGDILHEIRENFDSARIAFSAVREQMERLKKVNIDTSECSDILEKAHEQLAAQNFDEFRDTIAQCSTKASTLFEKSINALVDETKGMISRAKSMGINTKACEDLLEIAQTSFSEKLWDFAYQQAQDCRARCTELIDKKLNGLMLETDGRLEVLGHLGAGVNAIKKEIEEAKAEVSSGEHLKAFETLMGVDQKIAIIEESNKKFVDISIAAESAIENLRSLGGNVKEAERLLALADLEKEKDYDSAIELVAEALDTAQTEMESFAPDIEASIDTGGLQDGQRSDVTIVLKNNGRASAKSINVDLSGDFEVVDVSELPLLEPGREGRITVGIVPRGKGELSITAVVSSKRQFDGVTDTFELEGKLNVYAAGPPFKISRAVDVARCQLCHGKIKQGFDIVSCRCGSDLHLMCAKRSQNCPVCGQKFEL